MMHEKLAKQFGDQPLQPLLWRMGVLGCRAQRYGERRGVTGEAILAEVVKRSGTDTQIHKWEFELNQLEKSKGE